MLLFLQRFYEALWGGPILVLLVGAGAYLTVCAGFPQLRLLPKAFALLKTSRRGEGVTAFQALCTALAATVGTGNIVGVAGAICLGGPGAIFWMWVCGFLGMGTKFAEVTLARRYAVTRAGERWGGPMYMIEGGLSSKFRFLAVLYCAFGLIAAFGVGNATQINAVVGAFNSLRASWGGKESLWGNLALGIILAVGIGRVLSGGAGGIGKVVEKLVPWAAAGYVGLCFVVLLRCRGAIPGALRAIFLGAWNPGAVTGGCIGAFFCSLRTGCARGIFTNEAGMGTASMAYAGADTGSPVELGMLGLIEVFVDTLVICTLTALAVLTSGVSVPYGEDQGAALAAQVFQKSCGGWAVGLLTVYLGIFAFATVLGWGLYGARCGQFLFGPGFWKSFVWLQMAGVVLGAVLRTQTLWLLAEIFNGLMAIPNLAALLALSPELGRLTREKSLQSEDGFDKIETSR